MSANVITMPLRPMTRAQVQTFLDQDTVRIYGAAVWWTAAGTGTSDEVLVQTGDRVTAALAADELVRRHLNDSLHRVFGEVIVSEPMSVELLGQPGDPPQWQPARRPGPHTVTVCRVAAGPGGAQ